MDINVVDIKRDFGDGKASVHALKGISIDIKQGDYISFCGVSGSGKSTLLHILGCLDKPTSGQVLFGEEDSANWSQGKMAKFRNDHIGFVFQDYDLIPYKTVEENLIVPLYFSSVKYREYSKKVDENLERLGITKLKKRKARILSGGEKQKTAIARALMCDPDIIMADEPTGALDEKSKNEIKAIFRKIHESGKTLLVVTHDQEMANEADKVYHIRDGKLVKG